MPLALPGFLQSRLARPVAIFGAGVSGRGVGSLLTALGVEAAVYDAREREFTAAAASQHALVVFSPGFPPEHPWLRLARGAGCACVSEIDFASLCWRGRIVAVTGTNGKTTLTEFITHALAGLGQDAVATGNVGHAFSQLAAETNGGAAAAVAVCEVSSFQAETLRYFHAEAALWTNFAEDHLERHDGLEAYFEAKAELVARADVVFAGSSVRAFARQRPLAREVEARFVWVATEDQPADPRLAGTPFAEYPQRENFLLAAAWWRASGLEEAALYAAAQTFRLGQHRLARVAEIDGVTFWNDSKATNFHAVEAALKRFPAPVLLIAGGKAKGGDLGGFVRRIAPRVRRIFLIGETALLLAAACADTGLPHAVCTSLAEAVRRAAEAAAPGEHVLLSPGFASFDLFRNYEDRGRQFEGLVRARQPGPAPQ
jgi:UDP-N-acetylmuramoylalanine--D-glutamate ligase